MEGCAFANADGDLLIVPQLGRKLWTLPFDFGIRGLVRPLKLESLSLH